VKEFIKGHVPRHFVVYISSLKAVHTDVNDTLAGIITKISFVNCTDFRATIEFYTTPKKKECRISDVDPEKICHTDFSSTGSRSDTVFFKRERKQNQILRTQGELSL